MSDPVFKLICKKGHKNKTWGDWLFLGVYIFQSPWNHWLASHYSILSHVSQLCGSREDIEDKWFQLNRRVLFYQMLSVFQDAKGREKKGKIILWEKCSFRQNTVHLKNVTKENWGHYVMSNKSNKEDKYINDLTYLWNLKAEPTSTPPKKKTQKTPWSSGYRKQICGQRVAEMDEGDQKLQGARCNRWVTGM